MLEDQAGFDKIYDFMSGWFPKTVFGFCEFAGFYAAVVVAGVFTDNNFLVFLLKTALLVAFAGKVFGSFGLDEPETKSVSRLITAIAMAGGLCLAGSLIASEIAEGALAQMDNSTKSVMLRRYEIRKAYRVVGMQMECWDADVGATPPCQKLLIAEDQALANVK